MAVEVRLSGASSPVVAKNLADKLTALGHNAKAEDEALRLDADPDAVIAIELEAHDSPDFAADKILDRLEEAGYIALDDPVVSGEEEAEMEERLRGLGYLE